MFAKEQIIFFKGICEDKHLILTHLIEFMRERSRELAALNTNLPVVLCITSQGGNLLSTYNFLEQIILFGPRNIHTIALDDMSSAAFFLYVVGRKRYITPSTMCFLHRIHLLIDEYCKTIAGACKEGITPDSILNLMTETGTDLTATDILSMGLAHEILSPEWEKCLRVWRDENKNPA
ncbi:MAG: ATP-dependent Clp protease proteolytic subunit [Parcubacteria group bacterium]|nr:ATP-dependent Clp protease proteolytic subunit [Parcubacteria group bacterium]